MKKFGGAPAMSGRPFVTVGSPVASAVSGSSMVILSASCAEWWTHWPPLQSRSPGADSETNAESPPLTPPLRGATRWCHH
jgi:hypothetical protein